MNKKIKFNAVVFDFNKKGFEKYNIFDNVKAQAFIFMAVRDWKNSHNDEELEKSVDGAFKYAYWSKSEYEVVLTDMICNDVFKKVDVYDQIKMNWDVVMDMIKKYSDEILKDFLWSYDHMAKVYGWNKE